MSLSRRSRAAFLLFAVAAGAACSDSSPTEPAVESRPWTVQFTFGNTSINTGEIATIQDGVSADIVTDYVLASDLPNVDLELFITHAYLPTDVGVGTRVSNVSVRARRTDGSATPDFFRSVSFVQQSTFGGQTYDVYRLEGLFLGSPALRPSNFANVNFDFTVEYSNATGSLLHSSRKTIEIYKR